MSVRIFVEGNDDKNFLIALLNDLKNSKALDIDKSVNFNNYIEVMGSKSKLLDASNFKYQKITPKIGFSIKRVLFIFDCDFKADDSKCNGIDNSKRCFERLIKELNWDNISIDYYIFDKNLDYFLVETIKDKECYDYFDRLVECSGIENIKPNRKPIANLYRDLYPYPQFDLKDSRFQEIKDKLIKLFKGA